MGFRSAEFHPCWEWGSAVGAATTRWESRFIWSGALHRCGSPVRRLRCRHSFPLRAHHLQPCDRHDQRPSGCELRQLPGRPGLFPAARSRKLLRRRPGVVDYRGEPLAAFDAPERPPEGRRCRTPGDSRSWCTRERFHSRRCDLDRRHCDGVRRVPRANFGLIQIGRTMSTEPRWRGYRLFTRALGIVGVAAITLDVLGLGTAIGMGAIEWLIVAPDPDLDPNHRGPYDPSHRTDREVSSPWVRNTSGLLQVRFDAQIPPWNWVPGLQEPGTREDSPDSRLHEVSGIVLS